MQKGSNRLPSLPSPGVPRALRRALHAGHEVAEVREALDGRRLHQPRPGVHRRRDRGASEVRGRGKERGIVRGGGWKRGEVVGKRQRG